MPCPRKVSGCDGPGGQNMCSFCKMLRHPVGGNRSQLQASRARGPVQRRAAPPPLSSRARGPVQRRPAPPPPSMGPRHYEAFVKDLKSRTKKFTPFWSSTKGLLDFLKKNIKKPTPFASVEEAKKQCKNPKDERLGKYEPALRSLVKVWGTNKPYRSEAVPVRSGGNKYSKHNKTWSGLTVTDIPTRIPGKYTLKDGFQHVDTVKGAAIAWTVKKTKCLAENVESKPEYWLKMGFMASKPTRFGLRERYVRCFTCAAIAAYSLVRDSDFNNLDIAVVGVRNYDHYFVVVGSLTSIKRKKHSGCTAVDLWDSNLNNGIQAVNPLQGFKYASEGLGIRCEFPKEKRKIHANMSLV